jgi:hypothetical protein
MDEPILRCDGGNSHGWVPEMESVGDDYRAGVPFDEGVTLVVIWGRADVEPVIAVEVPGATCCWFCMDEDAAHWWSQRGGIKIKRSGKVLPGGDCWLCS